jgi:hypothetical protein
MPIELWNSRDRAVISSGANAGLLDVPGELAAGSLWYSDSSLCDLRAGVVIQYEVDPVGHAQLLG